MKHLDTATSTPLIQVENLTKIFTSGLIGGFEIRAVDDVTFNIKEGEIVSLVGESGSGKTTIGKLILRLINPTSGRILYKGEDVTKFNKKKLRNYYYKQVQAIFQDPFSSFNPLHKADGAFDMIFSTFLQVSPEEKEEMIHKALEGVGLNPEEVLGKYPHELSGGQLQRILIARALLINPNLLIADEAVSMLDASTRIDILNLLGELRDKYKTSILFITHDLALGYYISDTTIIMYRGVIVEMGDTREIFHNPQHPYTQMLLESIPDPNVKWQLEEIRPEKEERGIYQIKGCRYAPRCPLATQKCWQTKPPLKQTKPDHWTSCHRWGR